MIDAAEALHMGPSTGYCVTRVSGWRALMPWSWRQWYRPPTRIIKRQVMTPSKLGEAIDVGTRKC